MRITFVLAFIFASVVSAYCQDAVDPLLLNGQYTEAITIIDTEILRADESRKSMLVNKKAEALIHLGNLDEGEKLLGEQLKTATSPFMRAVTLSTLGLLYINEGRYDKALESLQESSQLFQQSKNEESLEHAQAISYLGLVYQFTGKHTQAQEQMQVALNLRLKKLDSNHELIAASYNDLGLCFARVDNDKALDYYEKALTIYQKLHGKEHPKIAIASINTGYIYNELELYGDAVNNFETALKIWEKVHPGAHQTKAFALFNLGNTYAKMGDQKAAIGYYERALGMYRDTYGNKHPEIAGVLNALANVELAQNKFDEALAHYQEALIANVPGFQSKSPDANPDVKSFYHGTTLLYTMLYKAEAFEKRYAGKTLKFTDLLSSLNTLQYCDTLIDKLRQQSSNENDKITLGIIANDVYADGVRIAYETAQNSLHKKYFERLAFYFAEKSKSAILLEAISDSNAKSFAGIPSSLIEQEKSIKSEIALTALKLSQKPTEAEEKVLRETSFRLNNQYQQFTRSLERDYPQYFNLKYNTKSPSVEEIQKLLPAETAVLSYFTDDRNNRIYIFSITARRFDVTTHALPEDFNKLITGFRNSLYFNEVNTLKKTGYRLGEVLISRLRSSVKDLIILPTGRLSIIPFETLLTKKPSQESGYRDISYLIHQYDVRYEFSASLFLQKNSNTTASSNPSIFLCAPVTFPEKDQLAQLPGTEAEVKEISKLFSSKNLSASINLGPDANETLLKSNQVSNYTLLHFATHGVVDEANPELSRIYLQTSPAGDDGNLFSSEIYNLNLSANLVTLSACQTGLGKISKGEGVIGLSRAMVYAGAKNIIVSFWSVADESTSLLMKNFYTKLLNENATSYTASLRKAKMELMKSEQYAAPYYWAPFILIGF